MPKKYRQVELKLNTSQHQKLQQISQSRTVSYREVIRAKILLEYEAGTSVTNISKLLKVSRPTIYLCIDKAFTMGPDAALKDLFHRPKDPVITKEAKAWIVNLACTKPTEHGYAAEMWTLSQLATHARTYAPSAGYVSLKKAVKATIHRILKEHPVQPHKKRYYLEKRDPKFDEKMQNILLIYKEVNTQNNNTHDSTEQKIITVSVDEKPGVQAIKNRAPDLPPVAGKHPQMRRDHEYVRLGTLSILAALDLHNGQINAEVHDRHRSIEFISLLKKLDSYYPSDCTIRLILDNHSSHTSKETRAFLATKPNRFIYVHTPTHGSWLNIVETLFSKMARTFLKQIRVQSLEELRERILKGIDEINASPVVHQWKNFDFAPS